MDVARSSRHVATHALPAYVNLREPFPNSDHHKTPTSSYMMIDEGLVLPSVRANIEANCKLISLGTKSFDEVVGSTIADFKRRFERLVRRTKS